MSLISRTQQHNRFRLLLRWYSLNSGGFLKFKPTLTWWPFLDFRHAARATFPVQQRLASSNGCVNTLDYLPLIGKFNVLSLPHTYGTANKGVPWMIMKWILNLLPNLLVFIVLFKHLLLVMFCFHLSVYLYMQVSVLGIRICRIRMFLVLPDPCW
jgi:hypothetical protein